MDRQLRFEALGFVSKLEFLVATVARPFGFAWDWTVDRVAISTLPGNSVHALASVATEFRDKA